MGLQKTYLLLLLVLVLVLSFNNYLVTVVFCLGIATAATIVALIVLLLLVSVRVNEEDVYTVLSATEWRNRQCIEKELRRLKQATEHWRIIAGVDECLHRLEQSDLVEKQESLSTDDEPLMPDAPRTYEYRRLAQKIRYRPRLNRLSLVLANNVG